MHFYKKQGIRNALEQARAGTLSKNDLGSLLRDEVAAITAKQTQISAAVKTLTRDYGKPFSEQPIMEGMEGLESLVTGFGFRMSELGITTSGRLVQQQLAQEEEIAIEDILVSGTVEESPDGVVEVRDVGTEQNVPAMIEGHYATLTNITPKYFPLAAGVLPIMIISLFWSFTILLCTCNCRFLSSTFRTILPNLLVSE